MDNVDEHIDHQKAERETEGGRGHKMIPRLYSDSFSSSSSSSSFCFCFLFLFCFVFCFCRALRN